MPGMSRMKPRSNAVSWVSRLTLVADYIDNFYNVRRRHSYLGHLSPAEYEMLWHDIQTSPQLS
ncbi:transposase InsO family protein [Nocardia sp. GAS34]